MNTPHTTARTWLASWLLALVWLCTIPGVLPLAFATVAKIDGEHGIEIGGSASSLVLTLTHGSRSGGLTHDQLHRHKFLGRLLTSFAESASDRTPDHFLKFTSSGVRASERKATVPGRPMTADTAAPAPSVVVAIVVLEFPKMGELRTAELSHGSLPPLPGRRHALLI